MTTQVKKKKDDREVKFVGGRVTEVKEETREGVRIGIVEGYIATWDIDEGDFFGIKDRFKRGAFVESILEHIQRNGRQVRLKDHHGRTVGGFPIGTVQEDERGLFGRGEINLEVQQGLEAYMLAKQGVLTDFSIGFSVIESEMDGDVRTITKALIWEGSIVDEPMNRAANITAVKKEGGNMQLYKSEDVNEWTERDVEKALREGAQFSKNAAKIVISIASKSAVVSAAEELAKEAEQKSLREMVNGLNSTAEAIKA